jgi:hypothetical protein
VVAYSPAFSQPDLSRSAPANLSIVFTAQSSNDSVPFPSCRAWRNPSVGSRAVPHALCGRSCPCQRARSAFPRGFWESLPAGSEGCFCAISAGPAIRAGGASGSSGACAARLCHKRKVPVRSRKQAAAPARKRSKAYLLQDKEIRLGETCVRNGRCQSPRVTMPLHRCRSIAATRGGAPSGSNGGPDPRSRTASLASAVRGRRLRAKRCRTKGCS